MMIAPHRSGFPGHYRANMPGLLGLLGLSLLLLGCSGGGDGGTPAPQESPGGRDDQEVLDPRVFPPSSIPFVKVYAEWSTEWWQWASSMPASENPLLDVTGEKCAVAQHGPVWFLAGATNLSGAATRHCSVPEGMALFFPVLAVERDNIGLAPPRTESALRDAARSSVDGVTNLSVEVDGIPIRNVSLFRFTSPVFSFALPQNNVLQALGNTAATMGIYFPAVADGFYMMLKPLPVGEHTLRMRGNNAGIGFAVDVTYRLTVGPLILP